MGMIKLEGRAPARLNKGDTDRADARERVPPICPYQSARKRPAHCQPVKDGMRSVVLFVSVCVKNREPIFDNDNLVSLLLTVWNSATKWVVGQYVIMPDHVHFFCAPNSVDCSFRSWMAYWKSMFSKEVGRSVWQRDCWDVQIRDAVHYREKSEYMLMNPVTRGLVDDPKEWNHKGVMSDIHWHDR